MEQVLNVNNIVSGAADNARMFMDGKMMTEMLIVMVVVGLLFCLFGLKLVRLMTTLTGFIIGAVIGLVVCAVMELTGTTALIVVLAASVVLALLAFFLYRVGVFFLVLNLAVGAAGMLIDTQEIVQILIALVIAIILAVLAVMYIEPIVIITTSLAGGTEAGLAVAELTGLTANPWIQYGIMIAFGVVGMIVQFMMQSRKVGKKEKIYSKKIKESVSVESEVEKARMILDDEAEEEESSSTIEFLDDDLEIIDDLDDDLGIIEDIGENEDN